MTPDPVAEAKHSTRLNQEIAEWGRIYECVAGSQLVGVNLDDSDDDRLGVCIEPPGFTLGLSRFEQYIDRSKPMGERSGVGDHDRTIYSLRKFASLALGGNPTILSLLFAPPEMIIFPRSDAKGIGWFQTWQDSSDWFASKRAGNAFLGYMMQQRQRLLGERGQKGVKRPELEAAFGYDTKYAAHVVRLGLQGIEYLTTGQLYLPMLEASRNLVLDVRRGKVEFNDMLALAGSLESELKSLLDTSVLPEQPDYSSVNAQLIEDYRSWYEMKGWSFK